MRISRRFINFAILFCLISSLIGFSACKGRTLENVEPTGDTVEVIIMQDTIIENSNQ